MRPTSRLFSPPNTLASRTIHVKIHPTARTFAERREVLRVLERFGEITMFRSLKYHPVAPVQNAFLAIFSKSSSAQEIINASPIRYHLTPRPTSSPSRAPSTSKPQDSNQETPTPQTFSLNISFSHYPHHTFLQSILTNPLHGPYKPISPLRSAFAAHLSKNLDAGTGPAKKGMCDWEDRGRREFDDETGDANAGYGDAPWRVVGMGLEKKKKAWERGSGRVMGGLRGLVGGGERVGRPW